VRDRPVRQWLLDPRAGTLSPGFGNEGALPPDAIPTVLTHRIETDAAGDTRITIHLLMTVGTTTTSVALSGGSDGAEDGLGAWRLASSTLVDGDARTLGQLHPLDPDKVSCGVREGRLDVLRWGGAIPAWWTEGRW
jgi:hypothetical protein